MDEPGTLGVRITTIVAIAAAIALGLSAGAMLAEAVLLVPYWQSLAAPVFLGWYAANGDRLLQFFAPLEVATASLGVAAAGLYGYRRRSGGGTLAIAALLAVGVLIPFPLYFRDVNASFATATIDPALLPAELARWARWHWLRTGLGTGAFIAALLALSVGREES